MSKFKRHSLLYLSCITLFLANGRSAIGQVEIKPDVVYGHKHGLAMTFDVFAPEENANGAGVLFMVSGGWYSRWAPPEQTQRMLQPLLDSGFTVFAVRHGSSPKYSIAEAVADVRRSVRFIRLNADRFGVDPDRLGVFGFSAGGHLSLMLGTASDGGDEDAKDAVDKVSNRVAAVVAFVAPTDLRIMAKDSPERLPAYDRFPALEIDIEDAKADSPLVHVSADDPPTLLIAGDEDKLVPISHSREIQAAFEKAGVNSDLIEVAGAGHGFKPDEAKRTMQSTVEWFQEHLTK